MNVNRTKKLAAGLFLLPLLALFLVGPATPPARVSAADEFDAAAVFKAKCAMCHGQKAEKSFDATKAEDALTAAILQGVKPRMPAYESKGINAEQAKKLVDHMKSLKQ